jgi:hypothetical protein
MRKSVKLALDIRRLAILGRNVCHSRTLPRFIDLRTDMRLLEAWCETA